VARAATARRAPSAPLRPRRRDCDRARRAARVRPAADAPSSCREPGQQTGGGDALPFRLLRRPALEWRAPLEATTGEAAEAPREAGLRDFPGVDGPGPGPRVAGPAGRGWPRRCRRPAAPLALPAGLPRRPAPGEGTPGRPPCR